MDNNGSGVSKLYDKLMVTSVEQRQLDQVQIC